jgi:hypothetical protein
MTDNVQDLFMYIFVICVSSLEKQLFSIFAYFNFLLCATRLYL